MSQINLTAKEIHIIVQAIRICSDLEKGEHHNHLIDYAKRGEIEQLKNKLQNIKDI